jgi:hypothetical protein
VETPRPAADPGAFVIDAAVAPESVSPSGRMRARLTDMSTPPPDAVHAPHRLGTSRVLRVNEHACEVWRDGDVTSVSFARMFPSPRVERVSPGHLVAIATGPDGADVVVWRWFDAVVLGPEDDGCVRLWEPAHGEVVARARSTYQRQEPGSRAWASSGLPGAQWWVTGGADGAPAAGEIDLAEVDALYTGNGLWSAVFDGSP